MKSSTMDYLSATWKRLTDHKPEASGLSGAFERVSFTNISISKTDLFRLENRSLAEVQVDVRREDVTYNILLNDAARNRIAKAMDAPANHDSEEYAAFLIAHGGLMINGYDGDREIPAMIIQRNDGARIEVSSKDGRKGSQQLFDQSGKPHGPPRIIPL